MGRNVFAYAQQLAVGYVSLWFLAWAIRRRYEMDCQLSRAEQIVRWSTVAVGFGLTFLQGDEYKSIRFVGVVVSLGFFAWPNFARSLSKLMKLGSGSGLDRDDG
jgi:hypothetical protein